MTREEEVEYWLKMSNQAWSQAQDLLEISDKYWEFATRLRDKQTQEV